MLRRLTQPETAVDAMGVRLRGVEMTRLETFVDAAFAFSVTMLALSPDRIPRSFDEMMILFKGIPAFLVSLALLLLFWNGHVRMSRRWGLQDRITTFLSCVFIAVMLVYVYPLKYMIGTLFEYVIPALRTPGFASTFGSSSDLAIMFVVMSTGFVGLHIVLGLLDLHAARRRDHIGLSDHEARVARFEASAALVYIAVGLVSIAIAVTFRNSGTAVMAAGYVYAALAVLMPIHRRVAGPSRRAIAEATADGTA